MASERTQRTPEEQRKRPLNRMQTVYPIRALQNDSYKLMQQAKEAGRPVVWSSGDGFYRHIYKVMGMEDVYGDGYGPVLAASGNAPFFLDRCFGEGFPNHMCGYYLVWLGYAGRMADIGGKIPAEAPPGREIPKPDLIVTTPTICDTHFKAMQSMGRFFPGVPTFIGEDHNGGGGGIIRHGLRDDREEYEHAIKFVVSELKQFVLYLQKLFGIKLDWDAVVEDLDMTTPAQDLWYEITEKRRKATPCPMNSRDHYTAMTAIFFRSPKDASNVIQLYKNLQDELQYRIDNKIAGINRPEKYRVMFAQQPPWHHMSIFEELAERGWNSVAEHYDPRRPVDLSWVKDPVEKLIRFYRTNSYDALVEDYGAEEADKIMEDARLYAHSDRMVMKRVQDYKVDGVLFFPLRNCRSGNRLQLYGRKLMEVCKVPSMSTDIDHIDPRAYDPSDFLKRAEAFEETMDHYKEVRKKEGFDW